MPTRDHYLETSGVRLRYRCAGAGPALVLLHGWALDLEMWTPQLRTMSTRYRLVAPDRRGFGLSTGIPDLQADVDDLDALLAELGVERPAIVGMSQGARVALAWAARHPERTAAIVLDGPPRDGLLRTPPGTLPEIALEEYRSLVRIAGIDAFRAAWLRHPLMQLRTSDARMHELLAAIVGRYAGRDLSGEANLPATSGQASAVTAPVLVINGEQDTVQRRATGELLAHMMPNAQRVLVPRAGHLPNLDNPAVYQRALGDFLGPHLLPIHPNANHRSISHAEEQSRRHRR